MASTHPLVAGGGGAYPHSQNNYNNQSSSLLDPFAHHPYLEPIGSLSRGAASAAAAHAPTAPHSAASGRLVLARDRRTGEHVAVKLIPRGWDDPLRAKLATRELLLHQALSLGRHPHVVGFREAFLSPTHLCVAMEYVERGEDLQTFLANTGGRVSEALARFLFQQLALAVDFLHAKGVVSRDIRLANALLALSPGQLPLLKLRGFALGKDAHRHSAPRSQVGSALFAAPEVMHNFSHSAYDGRAADVWSLGVVLFVLLFGRHPLLSPADDGLPEHQQALALFTRAAKGEFCPLSAEERSSVSADCLDLVTRALQVDPAQRAPLTELLQHPWFRAGLPEGAAVMNTTVLAEESLRGKPRQAPDELERMVLEAARGVDPAVLAALAAGGAGAGAGGVGGLRDTQRPGPLSQFTTTSSGSHWAQQHGLLATPVVTGGPQQQHPVVARPVVSGGAGGGAAGAGPLPPNEAVHAALARAPSPLSALPPASALPPQWQRHGQHAMAAAAYFDNSESGTGRSSGGGGGAGGTAGGGAAASDGAGGNGREAAAQAALRAHEAEVAAAAAGRPTSLLGAYAGQESFSSTAPEAAAAGAAAAAVGGAGNGAVPAARGRDSFTIDRLTTTDLDVMMQAAEQQQQQQKAGGRGASRTAAAAATRLSPIPSLPVVPSLPAGAAGAGQIEAALTALMEEEQRRQLGAGAADGKAAAPGDSNAAQKGDGDEEDEDDPYAELRDFIVDEDDLPPVARGVSSAQLDLREMSQMLEAGEQGAGEGGPPRISAAAAAAALQQQQRQQQAAAAAAAGGGGPPGAARNPSWFDICREMSYRSQQHKAGSGGGAGAAAAAPAAAAPAAAAAAAADGGDDGGAAPAGGGFMTSLLQRISTLDEELRAMSLTGPPPRLEGVAE